MKGRWILAALAAPMLLAGAAHPTPVVKLVEHADAIRQSLSGAQRFFMRSVTIGQNDLAAIRKLVDYTPDNPDVQFYIGKSADGGDVGVVLFPQANTVHGPVEVALAMTPEGKIARVTVTRATVETKPWVEEAIATGFLSTMKGLSTTDNPATAVTPLKGKLGGMSYFEAEVIAAAVERGLVVYRVLYHRG
jgi:hypothetical protein